MLIFKEDSIGDLPIEIICGSFDNITGPRNPLPPKRIVLLIFYLIFRRLLLNHL